MHPVANGWPIYFCTRELDTPKLKLKAGELFPWQSKPTIRGLGQAFGVEDAMTADFASLPYVEVLDAGSVEIEQRIRQLNLKLKDAKKLVREPAAA